MNNLHRHFILMSTVLLFSPAAFSQVIPDSSIRKKINDIHSPLQRLLILEPAVYRYDAGKWKDIRLPGGNQYGFLPENVELAFPELVSVRHHSYMTGKNLYRTAKIKTVDTESLIPVLVASVKEMQSELEKLRKEMLSLKKEMSLADVDKHIEKVF